MYYILLSLLEEECGVDIMNKVGKISGGRISVGPGTLYTLLDKFLKASLITETKVEGRRKNYIITNSGKEALMMERKRLKMMLDDGSMMDLNSDEFKEGEAVK